MSDKIEVYCEVCSFKKKFNLNLAQEIAFAHKNGNHLAGTFGTFKPKKKNFDKKNPQPFTNLLNDTIGPLMLMATTAKKIKEN